MGRERGSQWEPAMAEKKFKLAILGDGAIGKTCLVARFSVKGWNAEMDSAYMPTTFNDEVISFNYDEDKGEFDWYDEDSGHVKEDEVKLEIWDTAGQEAFETLRHLAYPGTHLFLIGYDSHEPKTMENLLSVWKTEINGEAAKDPISKSAPRILVGTKADLRDEKVANGEGEGTVKYEQAYEVARELGCCALIETSAKTEFGRRDLRDLVMKAGCAYLMKQPCPLKLEDFAPSGQTVSAASAQKPTTASSDTSAPATSTSNATKQAAETTTAGGGGNMQKGAQGGKKPPTEATQQEGG